MTGAFGLPRTWGGSAPFTSPAGSGVGVAAFRSSRTDRRTTQPAATAARSTIRMMAKGKNRFITLPGLLNRVLNGLVEIAVNVDVYAVISLRPVSRQLQVAVNFILKRVGRVVSGLDLFILFALNIHGHPHITHLRALFGLIEFDDAVDRVVARLIR